MEASSPPHASPSSALPPQEKSSPAPRLPRAGTFRQKRPVSTGVAGLRRGSTFANRPQSLSAAAFSRLKEESLNAAPLTAASEKVESAPRLRRGASFQGRLPRNDDKPVLRRAARRDPDVDLPPRSSRPASVRLPRAGTFAFGQVKPTPVVEPVPEKEVSRVASSDDVDMEKRSCGMCSSCETGLKAMPPWAPERLALMTEEERGAVRREMQHKEELGRLEAELRKTRVAEQQAVSARLQARRERLQGAELEVESVASESICESEEERRRLPSDEFDELESVDLGAEDVILGKNKSRRRGRSQNQFSVDELDVDNEDDIGSTVNVKRKEVPLLDRCPRCDDLEDKVSNLEEQLDVLKEVVKICGHNDAMGNADVEEDAARKGKGWMGKIASAYYGSSAAASEKTRLKAEVEALRRATDYLFEKLQSSRH